MPRTYILTIAIIAVVAPTTIQADHCDSILWKGIHNELQYNNEAQFQKDVKRIVNMSIQQRLRFKTKNEGNLSLGLIEILDLGLGGKSDRENLEEFKHLLQIDEHLAFKSRTYESIKLKLVDKNIVNAWLECKKRDARGIQWTIAGNKSGQFILNVDNLPRRESDGPLTITGVQATGAKTDGNGTLKKGATLARYSGLSEIFQRIGRNAIAITITFDKAPSLSVTLPAIEPPRAKSEAVQVTKAISAYGNWPNVRGDTEMDTDGDDRVPVECNTTLSIKKGNVVLDIYFYCEEDGGDHTTFRGTRQFTIYTPPKGKKVVGLDATDGTSRRFTGGTVGENHGFNQFKGTTGTYWNKLDFRVDGDGRDDHTRVGVGGELKIIVKIQR